MDRVPWSPLGTEEDVDRAKFEQAAKTDGPVHQIVA